MVFGNCLYAKYGTVNPFVHKNEIHQHAGLRIMLLHELSRPKCCHIRPKCCHINLYVLWVKWEIMQCNAVQCSAVQYNAVQCSAVQCSAMQCSTMQCMQCKFQCNAIASGLYYWAYRSFKTSFWDLWMYR